MFRRLLKASHLLRPRLCVPDAISSPSLFKSLSSNVSSKDYLVSSLSLSPQSIEELRIIKCKPISIKSTSDADSVIALFTDYGFTHAQIATILTACPVLLTFNPHDNLKPKLDFLVQRGISGDTLIHIATRGSYFLKHNLQKRIVPFIDFLQTFFGSNNHQTLNSFLLQNRSTLMIRHFSENTSVNVESLRLRRVPESSILRLFLLGGGPSCLAHDPEYFSKNLEEIMDMGFDPLRGMFPNVLRVYCGMSKEKWVSKMEVIKDCFGWTSEQVVALFMKQHSFMTLSEDKLRQRLEIFVKRLGWTPDYIAKYPTLLGCCLEKRIFPRISVLEILQLKGLVEKTSIGPALTISEDMFLRLFVNKYQNDLPEVQLIEVYANSMPNSKFGGSN